MVLGTAISALSVPQALAQGTAEGAGQAVNDISRYCTACWRNARLPIDSWSDCTQEVFSRLMQNLEPGSWSRVFKAEGEEHQEFLRAIDAVKKRTQRQLKKVSYLAGAVADHSPNQERSLRDEREAVQQAAEEVLSQRQQQILRMSFEGWTVQDMADELGMAPERVSDEKYKAIRKLRQHLQVD
jgi:RNA polymerase sigma factor (sigma-70 family)